MGCNCNDRTKLPNLGPCAEGKFFKARLLDCGCGNTLIPNTSPNGCPPQEPVIFGMRFFQEGLEVQTVTASSTDTVTVEVRVEEDGTSLLLDLVQFAATLAVNPPTQLTPLSWSFDIDPNGHPPGFPGAVSLLAFDTVDPSVASVPCAFRLMHVLYA